jgi:predicted acylesterase/phospholipase RssA
MELDPGNRHAIILSGGGAYAAYEVGVLKALFNGRSPSTGYRPIEPEIVSGTSAGAYNAVLLATNLGEGSDRAVAAMERSWLDAVAGGPNGPNGIYRWRANPFAFFDVASFAADPLGFLRDRLADGAFLTRTLLERTAFFLRSSDPLPQRFLEAIDVSSLISTSPMPGLIRSTIDFPTVRRSPLALHLIATNWRTGALRLFAKEELDDQKGPLIVMASSALPGIFPPVSIPPDVFVDGGLLMNTPLAPAIHDGATEIHVIYLDPDVRNIPLTDLASSLEVVQRSFIIMLAATINHDIEDAAAINRGIEVLRGAPPGPADARPFVQVLEHVRRRLLAGRPLRKLAIHRYHPSDLLGGTLGVLSFELDAIQALIDRGYRDALAHDCAQQGCILRDGGGVTG